MDKKDLYTLNLKLKRHKLRFEYDEQTDIIELSGVKADFKTPMIATGLIILGIAAFILLRYFLTFNVPYASTLFGGVPFAIGILMYGNLIKRRQDNKNKKYIQRDRIVIESRKGHQDIPVKNIARIHYHIKKDGEGQISNGYLFVQNNAGQEIKLLGMMGENVKNLDDDFNYLKRVISEFIGKV